MAADNCDCPACRIQRLIEIAEARNGTDTVARFLGRQFADVVSRLPEEQLSELLTHVAIEATLLGAVRRATQPAAEGEPTVHSEPQGRA